MDGEGLRLDQRHGKARVRVGRVWREPNGGRHRFVEWNVTISLLSDCLPAYTHADNSDIVATDTMKNTVYVKAKECKQPLSVEDFAIVLGKHFTSFYQQVTAAMINIVEKPWERIYIDGQPHEHVYVAYSNSTCSLGGPLVIAINVAHSELGDLLIKGWGKGVSVMVALGVGFKLGSEKHTTEVIVKKSGALQVISGVEGLAVLKTTQSGFEGFIRDNYTILPETKERMLATEVTASWRYPFETLTSIPARQFYFMERYMDVKKVLIDTFFGPPKEGVYSPSVQSTLYHMAKAVLSRFPDVSSVKLKMPNIHFLPVNLSSKDNPVIVKFVMHELDLISSVLGTEELHIVCLNPLQKVTISIHENHEDFPRHLRELSE
ncbi:hypothetical protein BUALT_Bualt06G0040100 [Buddleja alternifolia]|uniref:factor independent urate hydroxylase n=1 Tax=Buddleja alternifolia TaxID=168488 RepID=A0AAV6XJJ8_9LAMI|nr:hypothetical protein BUALT_Bualt06G0040100 [Buddleja alternifolia]